jgi:hypothetical protein
MEAITDGPLAPSAGYAWEAQVPATGALSLAERRALLLRRRRGNWWTKAFSLIGGALLVCWLAVSLIGLLQPLGQ